MNQQHDDHATPIDPQAPTPDALVEKSCQTCGLTLRVRPGEYILHQDGEPHLVIDPYDPTRAGKWGYTDAEICTVIPGLQEPTTAAAPPGGPKYPHVQVRLMGKNGNAFNLLGLVLYDLRQAGVSQAERDAFRAEATAGDYQNLLRVIMSWVEVV